MSESVQDGAGTLRGTITSSVQHKLRNQGDHKNISPLGICRNVQKGIGIPVNMGQVFMPILARS